MILFKKCCYYTSQRNIQDTSLQVMILPAVGDMCFKHKQNLSVIFGEPASPKQLVGDVKLRNRAMFRGLTCCPNSTNIIFGFSVSQRIASVILGRFYLFLTENESVF